MPGCVEHTVVVTQLIREAEENRGDLSLLWLDVTEVECGDPLSRSGIRQPPIRAFMDDLTVTPTSVSGCRWLLRGLERLINWTRMTFKPGQIQNPGLEEGEDGRQALLLCGWSTNVVCVLEAGEKSGQDLQWNPERHSGSPVNSQGSKNLAISNGQVSAPREVKA